MPHIHNKPDQHDITVSAWIVRKVGDNWKCLVHYHKKMDVLMQIGGHIELNETPWQAMSHELIEESGYELTDLHVLQVMTDRISGTDNIIHPVPFSVNTHLVGNGHYHSDLCYGFIADDIPKKNVDEHESSDLRWLTLDELIDGAKSSTVLKDVTATYQYLVKNIDCYVEVKAESFSTEKPASASVTYKRGKPGEKAEKGRTYGRKNP